MKTNPRFAWERKKQSGIEPGGLRQRSGGTGPALCPTKNRSGRANEGRKVQTEDLIIATPRRKEGRRNLRRGNNRHTIPPNGNNAGPKRCPEGKKEGSRILDGGGGEFHGWQVGPPYHLV